MGTWHLLHLLLRLLEALLGIFCLVTAILLYPSEDGKIRSALEDFWVRVDDYKRLALSRHAAFMTQVAQMETRVLDGVFGHKLFSRRAIAISALCSAGTCFGALSLFYFSVGRGLFKNMQDFEHLSTVCAALGGLMGIGYGYLLF